MRKLAPLAPALVLALLINAFGQQPTPAPARPTPSPTPSPAPSPQEPGAQDDDEDEVVRITTKLVQVDVTVTDKNGRQVTDLKPEDFEVFENDKPQTITNFSYIRTVEPAPTPAAAPPTAPTAPRDGVPVPPARLRPEQVRRTIALVVDDLLMSAESVLITRRALKKYVDTQVQPGDLVAIIRTSAGVGTLQQFTNDRQVLYRAIETVRWQPRYGGGQTPLDSTIGAETPGQMPGGVDDSRVSPKDAEEFRNDRFTVGTLGSLNMVVRGLREMPGRKAVILFSDGLLMRDRRGDTAAYLGIFQKLIDLANRASVVFYAIDARGVQPLGPTAADNTAGSPIAPGMGGGPLSGVASVPTHQIGQRILSARAQHIFEGQSGLSYLARGTGGSLLANQNDLGRGIRRALDDMSGYYLIGYRPDDSTFDPVTGRRRFHSLKFRIRGRSDLNVRTRAGFVGIADDEAPRPQPRTRASQLMAALVSPFNSGGVQLRLTSLFANTPDAGSVMRSLLLIDPRNVTFKQQPDGQYQATLDILAVTIGERFEVIDQFNRVETIRVRPDRYEQFMREGMIYDLNVPIKRPGAYQMRVAVRDAATERVGSAGQYVVVPDLSKNRLALSGLVLSGALAPGSARLAFDADPAVRRLRRGEVLDYGYVVYNARLDRAPRAPRLTVQARLLRDGREVYAGAPQAFDPSGQADLTRLAVAGRLQLGSDMTPGEYLLQVVVTDSAGGGRPRTATQWIDFEVVQ